MFIRVVYTAKLGKDRDTREAGIFTNSRGEMNLTFDKDIDWSEPVFMILEPAEGDLGYTHEYEARRLSRRRTRREMADEVLEEAVERSMAKHDDLYRRLADREPELSENYGKKMREKLAKREGETPKWGCKHYVYIRADGCEVFVRQDGTIKIYSNSEYEHKLGKRHCEQLLEALERVVER